MAGAWRLGEVAEIIMGQSPPGETYNELGEGLPFFQGVADFNYRFPTPRVYCTAPSRIAKPGDILLSVRAPIGRVNIADRECAIGRGLCIIRACNPEDARYLEFVLRAKESQWEAIEGSGSVFGNATRRDLEMLPIPWPEEATQRRAIAHILGTLDDKIELNRRMSEMLEQMARALFKAWFVDFEPVRAKCRGAPVCAPVLSGQTRRGAPGCAPACTPISSGQTQRSAPTGWQWPQHILDLFPDRLVDSELGEIPEGWEIVTLGQLMELAYGRALKEEDRRPGRVPVYGSNGQVGWHDEVLGAGPGIVVGRKGNPGTVTWVQVDFFAIDTTFYVVPKEKCRSIYFLFFALSNQDLPSLAADSAIPGLNRNFVYSNLQVIPPPAVLNAFDEVIKALFNRRYLNECESHTLAALRDTLLPKLISGELRVKDAERFLRCRGES